MRTVHSRNHQHPALSSAPITPSDAANLPECSRRIYVGGTGDITCLLDEDADDATPRVFKAVPIGEYDWSVKKVLATGTTATFMIAIY